MAHMDGFTYGWVNPVLAYLVACVAAALGLRCTVRALDLPRHRRRGWLLLAACTIGCGIWTMHFIAMMGFSVSGASVVYNIPLTLASLAVAIVVVGFGVFYVGYRAPSIPTLLVGGTMTGLGVAVMHYMGMAAMQLQGSVHYNVGVVAASVGIAVFAATAALWMTLNIRRLWASALSALVAGVAVCAMHYTAMLAVSVQLNPAAATDGSPAADFILPVAIGIVVFLTIVAIVVALSPEVGYEREAQVSPEPIKVTLFDGRMR
jgi:NO-binding membrane sensor protein with MHYT domain